MTGAKVSSEAGRGTEAERKDRRALVLHPLITRHSSKDGAGAVRRPENRLAESEGLARAIALDVVGGEVVPVSRPRAATLFRGGRIEELKGWIAADEIGLVVIDHALTPIQQRNLEHAWDCKVIDRTGLILEIFGARAWTREGRLQVEFAALSYQRSRLVRSWTHLERQRGGLGFVGGPGESQIEVDRRLIAERLTRIRRQLDAVVRHRDLHRRARRRVPYPVVALVGYTNAGKSTLFNRLAGAAVDAEDKLFATLDPTLRGVTLPSGRRIMLADTVGFISDLPTDLIAAFRATLEEVREADLVVHVRDAADPEAEAQREDVHAVLRDLDLGPAVERGLIEVLNKVDLLPPAERAEIVNASHRRDRAVAVSALTGDGCAALLDLLDDELGAARRVVELAIPHADGATLAWLYRHGEVLSRVDEDAATRLRVGLDPVEAARLEYMRTSRRESTCEHPPAGS